MKSKVQVLVNQEFPKWLSKNTKEGRAIVERCALAAKARMSAKKARELTKEKAYLKQLAYLENLLTVPQKILQRASCL